MSERLQIYERRVQSKNGGFINYDYVLDCPLSPSKKTYIRTGEVTGGRRCVSCPYLLVLREHYVACRCRYIQQMTGASDRL